MNQTFIDKYEIICTLGRGSMGVVYKAKDPEIGRLVAIKTLKSVFMGDDPAGNEALQRFRQESRSAGRLHHPNIVTIFEAGRAENGSPYIVMEYIEGKSLETMIKEVGALDAVQALHYLAQIASAVDYAHSQSVIHRDIKPSNILVDARQRPFLLDFGVAKLSDTSLTPAGTVVGTPSYMSPEQIRGAHLDGRTDIFSLAVVAFEIFSGTRPFPGTDFTTVVSNIIHKEPLVFSEVGCTLPAALETALKRGLSKDRDQRFQSGMEFVDACAKALSVVVDGTGIAGGYVPGMKLAEAQARDFGTRTRADTVLGTFYPQSMVQTTAGAEPAIESGGVASAAPIEAAPAPQSQPEPPRFHVNGQTSSAPLGPETAQVTRMVPPVTPPPTSQAAPRATADPVTSTVVHDEKRPQERFELRDETAAARRKRSLVMLVGVLLLGGILAGGTAFLMSDGGSDVVPEAEESAAPDSKSGASEERSGDGVVSKDVPPPDEEGIVVPPPVEAKLPVEDESKVAPPAATAAPEVAAVPASTPAAVENPEGDRPEAIENVPPVSATAPDPAPDPAPAELTAIPAFMPANPSEADLLALRDGQLLGLLNTALAERAASEALRLVIAETGRREHPQLSATLASLLSHPDYKTRVDVVKALSRAYHLDVPAVRTRLIKALDDEDFVVRGFVVKALAKSNAPDARKALAQRLTVEKNATVTELLRKALGR